MALTENEIIDLLQRYQSELNKMDFQRTQVSTAIEGLQSQLRTMAGVATAPVASKTVTAKAAKVAKPVGRKGRPKGKTVSPKAKVTETVVPEVVAAEVMEEVAVSAPVVAAPVEVAANEPKRRGRKPKLNTESAAAVVAVPKERKSKKKESTSTSTTESKAGRPKGASLSEWDQLIINMLKKSDRPLVKSDFDTAFSKKAKKDGLEWTEDKLYQKTSSVIHKLANQHGSIKKVDVDGKGNGYVLA